MGGEGGRRAGFISVSHTANNVAGQCAQGGSRAERVGGEGGSSARAGIFSRWAGGPPSRSREMRLRSRDAASHPAVTGRLRARAPDRRMPDNVTSSRPRRRRPPRSRRAPHAPYRACSRCCSDPAPVQCDSFCVRTPLPRLRPIDVDCPALLLAAPRASSGDPIGHSDITTRQQRRPCPRPSRCHLFQLRLRLRLLHMPHVLLSQHRTDTYVRSAAATVALLRLCRRRRLPHASASMQLILRDCALRPRRASRVSVPATPTRSSLAERTTPRESRAPRHPRLRRGRPVRILAHMQCVANPTPISRQGQGPGVFQLRRPVHVHFLFISGSAGAAASARLRILSLGH